MFYKHFIYSFSSISFKISFSSKVNIFLTALQARQRKSKILDISYTCVRRALCFSFSISTILFIYILKYLFYSRANIFLTALQARQRKSKILDVSYTCVRRALCFSFSISTILSIYILKYPFYLIVNIFLTTLQARQRKSKILDISYTCVRRTLYFLKTLFIALVVYLLEFIYIIKGFYILLYFIYSC